MILTHFLSEILASPVLRVLLVVGLGLLLGEITFPGGFKLGVAAVLFVGLLFGALLPDFSVPPVLRDLGLILFVYGVGLQTGPGFFRSFRKDGLRLNLAIVFVLTLAFGVCALVIHGGHLPADTVAGLFCGALTNTPALGAATEAIGHQSHSGNGVAALVVGYGVAYPFAILVVLSLIQFFVTREKGPCLDDSNSAALEVRTLRIANVHEQSCIVDELESQFQVRVTRIRPPNGKPDLRSGTATLRKGSLLTVVGTAAELERAIDYAGQESDQRLPATPGDLETADFRVSNHRVCGRPILELEAEEGEYVISRVRRGDVEIAASPTLRLQPGDEVRVVAHQADLEDLARFFGNSIAAISETSYLTFILGIVFGLLVGQVPIPVPGLAAPLQLGMAGGPLLVGIVLGWLGRTGPLVWTMSYGINLGIRNFGILLFLAAVGANAGSSLPAALKSQGLTLILIAVFITLTTHVVAWLTMKLAGERDVATLIGSLSGLQTQPAALSFSTARASAEKVQLGYASVYPLATILKIILVQLLLEIR
jgi:putative transport protein